MEKLQTGQPPGEAHPSAKLTESQVYEIRARVSHGETQKSLAFEYGVSPSTISKIVAGKSWSHLGPPPKPSKIRGSGKPSAKLTEEDVRAILVALSRGARIRTLARHYRVSPNTISKIRLGKTWTHVSFSTRDNPTRKKVWEK